jgi:hypothetical protein
MEFSREDVVLSGDQAARVIGHANRYGTQLPADENYIFSATVIRRPMAVENAPLAVANAA